MKIADLLSPALTGKHFVFLRTGDFTMSKGFAVSFALVTGKKILRCLEAKP